MTALFPASTSPETALMADALDALAATARHTDAARERLSVALATHRWALDASALPDNAVLCLDRDVTESYSIEEAREKAGRRPQRDLLAAGLESPDKP